MAKLCVTLPHRLPPFLMSSLYVVDFDRVSYLCSIPCDEVKIQPTTVKEGPMGSESSSAQNIQWFCVSFPCPQFYTDFEKYRREVRGHRDFHILLSLKYALHSFPLTLPKHSQPSPESSNMETCIESISLVNYVPGDQNSTPGIFLISFLILGESPHISGTNFYCGLQ